MYIYISNKYKFAIMPLGIYLKDFILIHQNLRNDCNHVYQLNDDIRNDMRTYNG